MKASPDRKNNFTGKSATKPDSIKNPVLNDVEKRYRALFDNATFPVELSSSAFTGYDGKELTAIIFRDISVRKNIELYLQKSETRYRNLFENSPIGIAITNKEGKLLQANLPFARMYGYCDPDQMSSEVKNVRELYFNSSNRSIWYNNSKFHLPC
jgi:hypothetical protein